MEPRVGLELAQSFVVVAEELNFRRAAERLNVDQSALSRRIQKLEHLAGFALFERTTREVSLTPAGRAFYEENAKLLRGYADSVKAARRIADGKTGLLRIGYMAFAAPELMPRAVARFRQRDPDVDLSLRYLHTQGQKLALADDELDIGFLIGPFAHSEFHSLLLAADPLYAVMPQNHALARKPDMSAVDLAGEDIVLGDMTEWAAYRWRIDEMFAAAGVHLNVRLEASNTLALTGLVAAGLGITVYPESLVGLLGKGVAVRPIVDSALRMQTILVWKRANRSATVRRFIELAGHLPAPG